MRQFVAYRNTNTATKRVYPLLLNVQSDLLDAMDTRVVVPLLLVKRGRGSPTLSALAPLIAVNGAPHVLMTPLMAGVAAVELGVAAADLSSERSVIMASIDLLVSGI